MMMTMKARKVINEVISPTNGLFQNMDYVFPEGIIPADLDIQFYSFYGERPISPITLYLLEHDSDYIVTLAEMVLRRYIYKWNKLQDVLRLEYNPLEPFNQTLDETMAKSLALARNSQWLENNNQTRTDNLTEETERGTNSTNTRTNNLTETDSRNLTTESSGSINDNIYGFNSPIAVGDTTEQNSTDVTESGSVTKLNTGTQIDAMQNSGSDFVTNTGTQKNDFIKNGNKNDAETSTDNSMRLAVRHGNIGNMSNQQLIKSEIDLWRWNFIEEVLKDAAEMLTLPIYI